ncbi:MAG: geranylgeranyl reductase family protein [Bacillota bacterium]
MIGAGPAGSTAGRELALRGHTVLLMDRACFPRDKPCGGLISYKALRELPDDVAGQPIFRISIRGNGYSASKSYPALLGVTVERAHFDRWLVDRAIDAGCTFMEGQEVTGIFENDGILRVISASGTLSARVAICATGAGALPIRGKRHVPWSPLSLGLGVVAYSPAPKSLDGVEFYLTGGVAGLGWVFPGRGRAHAGVGCSVLTRGTLTRELAELAEQAGLMICGATVWPMPGGFPGRRPACGRVLLVGDAGGFVDPFTGEGIYGAVRSGKRAAHYLDVFLRGGCSDPVRGYVQWARSEFGRVFALSWLTAVLCWRKRWSLSALVLEDDSIIDGFARLMRGDAGYLREWEDFAACLLPRLVKARIMALFPRR